MRCLDSDVLIAFLKGDPRAVRAVTSSQDRICTTILNAQEVLLGLRGGAAEKAREFLRSIVVTPYTWREVDAVLKVKRTLRETGRPIGAIDEMIAGICIANDMAIVTGNTRHFSRVEGLRVEPL